MDLRTKLVFALVSVSLASMLLLGLLTYGPARDIWRESAIQGLDALAESKQSEIEGIVESWKDRVRLIRSRTQLRVLTREFDATHREGIRPEVERILADARGSVPGLVIREITIYDNHQHPVATTRTGGIARAPTLDLTEVPSLEDGIRILGLSSLDLDVLEVRLAAPMRDEDLQVGTLLVRMSANELLGVASDYHGLGNTGESMIAALDGTGGVKFLHTPRHGDVTNLDLTLTDKNDPLVQALSGVEGTFDEDVVDYRNEAVWAATRYLPELEIGLVVKFDATEREAPLRKLRSNTFRFGIALSALSILVAIMIAFRFAGPILQLAEVVEKIESGNYLVRASVRTEDEIGRLAFVFNRMTDRLLESNRKLRQRIADREALSPPPSVGGPEIPPDAS
jgi:HAMP domain-containing protein